MHHYTIDRAISPSVDPYRIFMWKGSIEEWEKPAAQVFEGTLEQCRVWLEKRQEITVYVDNDTGDLHEVRRRSSERAHNAFEIRYWHFIARKATGQDERATESVEPPELPPNVTVLWESRPWAHNWKASNV